MNLDERIEAWLDGSLDDAGGAELARAVAADPALATRLAGAARLDLALGIAHGRRPDLAGGVMAGLRGSESRVRLRQSVMRDLPSRRRPVRRMAWPWVALAAAACLAAAVFLMRPEQPAPRQTTPVAVAKPAADLGAVVSAAATVQVRRDGQDLVAMPGLRLQSGDRVNVPTGAEAVIVACSARLELGPGSGIGIASPAALHLATGSLRATVEPRHQAPPLVFTTPQAQATVLGTVLSLAIADGATRLEVERGRVGLATRGRPALVEIAAGGSGLARPGSDPEVLPPMRPLFTDGLDGWIQDRGAWSWRDGVMLGGDPAERSRLVSRRGYADFALECRVRVVGKASGAEIQADDYDWYIRVPQAGGWHAVRITRRGSMRSASIDGQPVEICSGSAGGAGSAGGPIAFYVRDGGSIEIRDARVATPR